jgi:hypothetical protein
MWFKLIGLGVIEAAIIAVLFWPIKTHAVKLDMPAPGSGSAHTPDLALAITALGTVLVVNALMIAALLAPIWMAYRVIRAARRAH